MNEAIESKKISEFDFVIREYLVLGALRAKEYDEAISISEATWVLLKNGKITNLPTNIDSNQFSINSAAKALHQLKILFNKNNIEFFLVSGTLLGCIREKILLVMIRIWILEFGHLINFHLY